MPKSKKRVRSSKPTQFKLSKDLITGLAIGAIIIFVICLMVTPNL